MEFFEHLRDFLESTDESPAADADADANGAPSEDARDGSSERSEPDRPSRPVLPLHRRSSSAVTVNGITPSDKNAKNVDSGRVAIVFSSDALSTFYENWSGSSKERRRWILARLASLNSDALIVDEDRVKTIFIEVTLTKSHFEQNILQQKLDRDVREGKLKAGEKAAAAERWKERVHEYKKLFVTLQEDGSEDDLSYIKLINYGERVTTNRMRAYLPQRIVQFLTATHPTKHTIYLCRHGESEYNTTGRLGGNSPLTNRGWRSPRSYPGSPPSACVIWWKFRTRTAPSAAPRGVPATPNRETRGGDGKSARRTIPRDRRDRRDCGRRRCSARSRPRR